MVRAQLIVALVLSLAATAAAAPPAAPAPETELVTLEAADFKGGGAARFGHTQFGTRVNYTYAQPTGELARLTASFELQQPPRGQVMLVLTGRDDDAPASCTIEIALNGTVIAAGPNGFSSSAFQTRHFAIPPGALRPGSNQLTVTNTEKSGKAGMPPWFMVSQATLVPAWRVPVGDFHVALPETLRPIPQEPTSPDAPRFKFRGIKGWKWSAEQYLAEIPHLQSVKMNFLMNCYLSMFDDKTGRNRWWEPLPEAKKQAYAKVFRAARDAGITYCFAMHPQLMSDRPMNLESAEEFETFFAHFAWAQDQGVKWFSVSMDDVAQGHAGSIHAAFCNKFLKRLRARDPEAQLIFCPTVYATSQIKPGEPYLESLAAELDKDVYLFWTGPEVVPVTISRADAEHYRKLSGHRLILWDNYPVNDAHQALHLGPVTGRDPELTEVCEGYMGNALYPQSEINRVPTYTMADYAYNPAEYDPLRSIGQAVMHLADTPEQRRTLASLVEVYAGNLLWGNGNTGFNCVRSQFEHIARSPSARYASTAYIEALEQLAADLEKQFPDRYRDARATLAKDVKWLRSEHAARYASAD